ncbi:MAG: GDP-mannose 4,6-dehydratase [Actinomycetota bacterium]|nr:GDP-mannose 4,6-dehydratase [Actinomycetota bacterium]
MKALVTGAKGFVGHWLTRHLAEQGDELVDFGSVDILEGEAVRDALEGTRPDAVYHLAAASHVGSSWASPVEVLKVNAEGTLNVVLACEAAGVGRLLVVGSAEEYGLVGPDDLPIDEDTPLRPVSPYGASKVAAEVLALQRHRASGFPVIAVRAFNHLGPGQPDRLVASTLAAQVARNEAEGAEVILAGDLTARRDFTDVRDVVRAYRLLIEAGVPGEAYNVCSGADVAVSAVAEHLIGLASGAMHVELDPERLRPVDLPVLCGDPAKLRGATGWSPEVTLEATLADLLDWWRGRMADTSRPA